MLTGAERSKTGNGVVKAVGHDGPTDDATETAGIKCHTCACEGFCSATDDLECALYTWAFPCFDEKAAVRIEVVDGITIGKLVEVDAMGIANGIGSEEAPCEGIVDAGT